MSQALSRTTLQDLHAGIKSVCDASGGRSQFFPFGGSGYKASVTHYFESSTEISAFAVEPGSVEDLQSIVKVIAATRAPFAVKCGGHATNPGFSSTKGIQIHLARFNKITVHEKEKLVDVGAGCLFGELYNALAPYKLNIVGGSGLAGIGVTGWMLGGGYSTKTNQYGLGIDNVESAKLVLPDGTFKEVSAKKNEDLFFAIKGGGNNFGIITEFTLKAHEQGHYYSFQLTYEEEHHDAVKDAIANFVEKTDNKANLEAAFRHYNNPEGIQRVMTVHCTYDGTYPTDDPFGELRAIEHTIDNYGDPLHPRETLSSDVRAYESTASTEISTFHVADTLRSLDNETYDLSELPEDLAETGEVQYNVLMSGRLLPITEFVGDGSLRLRPNSRAQLKKPPTRPMVGISQFPRGRWGNVMVDKFTPEIIAEIEKQSIEAAQHVNTHGGRRVVISLWPFTKAMFDKATPAAWPHEKGHPNCPIIVYFTWEGKHNDAFWVSAMTAGLEKLRGAIHALSPPSKALPYFISTALAEATTVADLYRGHLGELSTLRHKYDAEGVMDLAGGFRIPLPESAGRRAGGEPDVAKEQGDR